MARRATDAIGVTSAPLVSSPATKGFVDEMFDFGEVQLAVYQACSKVSLCT